MKEQLHKRVIISGGGTGGHIFPAISIANALRRQDSGIEILFVGAEGRLEMEKVPAAGYKIVGLPIEGLKRKVTLQNLRVVARLVSSLKKAKKIIMDFKPDIVVGVGGYASGPVLYRASGMGIPTLIQEQNSYAGITNKLLAKRAGKICVAYDNMDRYFPAAKIVFTGNPVRSDIAGKDISREEALLHFGLKSTKKTVLVLGGSGGAGTINKSILEGLERIQNAGIQLIWQTGRYYYDSLIQNTRAVPLNGISILGFIDRMDYAYAAADVIISRAGAGTISELCIAARPVILVPSPNVAEDHQTKNALALTSGNAAITISDKRAAEELVDEMISLVEDKDKSESLSLKIAELAIYDSDKRIAEEVFKLIK
ncbi:MAG: undecaprenyldiphospho-muramoylpentapeptide beta-N-acetylglucosaminyltransferase [Marinilabiliaceae bacterium]|jgi:UDP-N-acetylglucosamine--N-acetylmuramyl-(pentapeptide) pyrophosphoryl-undecaprenol N-acetylglucosamine transferase|nr:undecaprenyldiphospho-muramoylpentapeptide beta-N-acetylglucosaminyltransferase [Marinilabiliaceae bacterium]